MSNQQFNLMFPLDGPMGGAATIVVDDSAHEVYIGDGSINRRLVVYDSNTGAFTRGWANYRVQKFVLDK